VHDRLRMTLAASPKSFEEPDVRGTITAWALFGFSVRWSRGDVVVCDRCVAFFQRHLIAQPPVLVFRSEAEANQIEGRWLVKAWMTQDPVLTGDEVELVAKRGMVKWKLVLRSSRARALFDAVRTMRHAAPPTSAAYR